MTEISTIVIVLQGVTTNIERSQAQGICSSSYTLYWVAMDPVMEEYPGASFFSFHLLLNN